MKYENYKQEYDYDTKFKEKKGQDSIIEDNKNIPKLVQLYSTDYFGRTILFRTILLRILCVKGARNASERDFSASDLVILFGIEEVHYCRKK